MTLFSSPVPHDYVVKTPWKCSRFCAGCNLGMTLEQSLAGPCEICGCVGRDGRAEVEFRSFREIQYWRRRWWWFPKLVYVEFEERPEREAPVFVPYATPQRLRLFAPEEATT